MKAAEAAELLRGKSVSKKTVAYERADEMSAALAAAYDRLEPDEQREVLQRLASTIPFALLDALRKRRGELLVKDVVAVLSDRPELRYRFVCAAARHGAGVEAAKLSESFEQSPKSPHLGALRGRLPKLLEDVTPGLAAAAREALLATLDEENNRFIEMGLLGVLAADSSAESLEVFERVIQAQEEDTEPWSAGQNRITGVVWLRDLARGPDADALVSRFERAEQERIENSQGTGWARALGLECAVAPDWTVNVVIESGAKGPSVTLVVHPHERPEWEVVVKERRAECKYQAGEHTGRDFGLRPLRSLSEFPSWLLRAGRFCGVTFAVSDAKVLVWANCAPTDLLERDADRILLWLQAAADADPVKPGNPKGHELYLDARGYAGKDNPKALRLVEAALEIAPDNERALVLAGDVCILLRFWDRARGYFEKAGDGDEALAGRARCAEEAGNLDECIRLYRRSLELKEAFWVVATLASRLLDAAKASSEGAERERKLREAADVCRNAKLRGGHVAWNEACALSLLQEEPLLAYRAIGRALRGCQGDELDKRIAEMKADTDLAWVWERYEWKVPERR